MGEEPVEPARLHLAYARLMSQTESSLVDFAVALDRPQVLGVSWGRHRGVDPTCN